MPISLRRSPSFSIAVLPSSIVIWPCCEGRRSAPLPVLLPALRTRASPIGRQQRAGDEQDVGHAHELSKRISSSEPSLAADRHRSDPVLGDRGLCHSVCWFASYWPVGAYAEHRTG